jgi:hypothetical protein
VCPPPNESPVICGLSFVTVGSNSGSNERQRLVRRSERSILFGKLESAIGLEPMTCRLRIG